MPSANPPNAKKSMTSSLKEKKLQAMRNKIASVYGNPRNLSKQTAALVYAYVCTLSPNHFRYAARSQP